MRALLYRTLILMAVIGLIVTPPVLTGYAGLEQAAAAMDVGEFSDAANKYERSAKLLPWRVDLWEQAGRAHFFGGEFNNAIKLFENASQHDSLSAGGWDWLGQSYWLTNDLETAIVSWNTGINVYPSHTKFYAHLSMAYYGQGDQTLEQWALEHWVATEDEPSAAAYYRLGQLLMISEPERAQEELSRASSLNAEYDPAVDTLQTTLDLALLETDDSRRLVIIGRGLGLVNEWQLATVAFHQAVDANEENAETWAWLGEAEQQLGRNGRKELEKALSLERENPIVRSLRGLYWMRGDRPDQALAEYLLAAEYDPENPVWRISIGEAYVLRGDLQAALGSYLRAIEIAPKDPSTWRALADFCARYNLQIEEIGLPAAQMAVELSGEDHLALDTLGWTLALLERYDEAGDALQHALSLEPGFAGAHLHLGILALQLDEWQAARDHIRQARDLDLNGPVGEQAQVLLNQYFP